MNQIKVRLLIDHIGSVVTSLILLIAWIGLGVACSVEKIQSDEFEIVADLSDDTLQLSLSTDLPDNTNLSVSVNRIYWQSGNSEAYSHDYFSESSTVGQWRSPRSIKIDNSLWKRSLEEHQKEMSRLGIGFDVSSISDTIDMRMVVPLTQDDPRFGERNENLVGKVVSTDGVRVIRSEVQLYAPIGSLESSNLSDPKVFWGDLQIGESYILEITTPVVPDPPGLDDPGAALENMLNVPQGYTFEILGTRLIDSTKWYEVKVSDRHQQESLKGWINSIALAGQELGRHSR